MKVRLKNGIAVFLTAMMVLVMAFQSFAAPLSSMNPAAASEPAKITGTWSTDASGSWRFNAPDGAAKDGWYYLNTTNNATDYNWFCFDANGVMRTGWVPDKNDPSVWYYTGETKDSSEGGMVKGWATDPRDGKRYYMDPSTGIMRYGWQLIGNVWYYFGEKQYSNASHPYGAMYVNEKTPDGYYVGSNGGWIQNYSENDSDDPDPAPKSYTVTFNMQGHGTQIAPIKNVLSGSKIEAPAAPEADGYTFGGWYKEAACTNAWSFDTDTVTADTTLYAKWTIVPSTYGIIVEDDGHGTAKAQISDADVTSAAPGATVTLVAKANDGYAFKEWQIVRGLEAGAITDNTFTMPSKEVKVKAVFEKEYAVEAEAGGHGTVSADVAKGVSGKAVNLTITPDAGYETDQVTVIRGGVSVTDNKFNIGTADVKIRVTFKAIVPSAYGIIVEDDGHGTAKAQVGGADVTSAAPGAVVTLVATANDGYAFKEWQIDRGLEAGAITDNTFTMPSKEVKVKAIFERVYNITLQTNEHGTASATVGGETATTAAANVEVTLTATPAEGYQFKEWKTVSGGVTVTENKFTMPASNVTVQAVFEAIPETKKISEILPSGFPTSADSAWVNADGEKAYKDGDNIKVGNLTLGKDTTATKSGDNYVCKLGDATVTFNVKDGAAESITVTGSSDSGGSYAPAAPTFKAVYDTTGGAKTLTFYYDTLDHSGTNITVYDNLPTAATGATDWGYNDIREYVKSVVIDSSVANYHALTSTAYMFHDMQHARSISGAEWLDVSNVTDMSNMFCNYGLEEQLIAVPDVSGWNTENVTDMSEMFFQYGCYSTELNFTLDLSKWSVANVTKCNSVFSIAGASTANWSVIIPANTGEKKNDENHWYIGDGTDMSNYISPATDRSFTPKSECIAAGTIISMPGGKQKAVEELEIGDVVCTFDHETGEVSSAPVCFIWESKNVGNAFTLTFEDDIEVTVIEEHGFYDQEEQKYVFINLQNAQEYIGDHFYHADSNNWLELKSCKVSNERVDAYAIITSGDLNHMSNGMLSMCDGTVKMIANIFEYDDRMRYDADKKKADIETYGLTPIEKILEFDGFIEAAYVDYNLQYLNVAIGKGLTTWERIKALSDYCVANGLVCIEQTNDVPMLGTEEKESIIIALAPRSKPESCEPEKLEEAKPEELIEPAEAVAEKPIEDTEPDTPETMD